MKWLKVLQSPSLLTETKLLVMKLSDIKSKADISKFAKQIAENVLSKEASGANDVNEGVKTSEQLNKILEENKKKPFDYKKLLKEADTYV